MKTNIITITLFCIVHHATAQITLKKLDSLINRKDVQSIGEIISLKELPKSSCYTIYEHIIGHLKGKNNVAKIKSYNALNVLYRNCKNGDSCIIVRKKIISDFIAYLENPMDSLKINTAIISFLENTRNDINLTEKERLRLIIIKKGVFSNWFYFISYFNFKEFIPEIWKIYEKSPFDDDGRLFSSKQEAISTLIILGDSSAIDLQKKMVWKYLLSKPKEVNDLAFYSWLDNIRITKSKAMSEFAFELMEYSLSNNPTILKSYDGDGGKFLTELSSTCYFSLKRLVKKYPFQFSNPYKLSKENIEKMLMWRKENINYQLYSFDD